MTEFSITFSSKLKIIIVAVQIINFNVLMYFHDDYTFTNNQKFKTQIKFFG